VNGDGYDLADLSHTAEPNPRVSEIAIVWMGVKGFIAAGIKRMPFLLFLFAARRPLLWRLWAGGLIRRWLPSCKEV
jgi:hypothetical protein